MVTGEPKVLCLLQLAFALYLLTPHFINRIVCLFNYMKMVNYFQTLRKLLTNSLEKGGTHVASDKVNICGIAAVLFKIFGKTCNCCRIITFCHKKNPTIIMGNSNSYIISPSSTCLINTNSSNILVIFQ